MISVRKYSTVVCESTAKGKNRKTHFTFRDFCKIPMGKLSMGLVVIHKRKLGLGFVILSKDFSSSLSHFTNKWQFCSINQWPWVAALSNKRRTTLSKKKQVVAYYQECCHRLHISTIKPVSL